MKLVTFPTLAAKPDLATALKNPQGMQWAYRDTFYAGFKLIECTTHTPQPNHLFTPQDLGLTNHIHYCLAYLPGLHATQYSGGTCMHIVSASVRYSFYDLPPCSHHVPWWGLWGARKGRSTPRLGALRAARWQIHSCCCPWSENQIVIMNDRIEITLCTAVLKELFYIV